MSETSKMYLKTALKVFTVIFLYTKVVHMLNVSEGNGSTHHILQLLDYQLESCDTFSWCSLQVGEFEENPCCLPCNCTSECKERNDCCPDYDFFKHLELKVHNNITLFKTSFMQWIEDKQDMLENKESMDSSKSCLRSQILKPEKYVVNSQSYMMISKCLVSLSSINPTQRDKCELNTQEVMPWFLSFADLVPVLSTKDGKIFKNEFCATCNAVTELTKLKVVVVSISQQNSELFDYNFHNPLDILNEALSGRNAFNIVFIPTHNVQERVHKHKCTKIDLYQCNNPDADDILNKTCAQFSSPILHINEQQFDGKWTVYKNAACLHEDCNTRTIVGTCYALNLHKRQRIEATLNIPANMYYLRLNETRNLSDLLAKTFSPGKFGCGEGKVYYKKRNACRQIFCPKELFASYGECQSMFTEIHGATFLTFLRVKPRLSLQEIEDIDMLSLLLYEEIKRLTREDGAVSYIDVSLLRGKQDFIAYLTIGGEDTSVRYTDVIQFIQRITKRRYEIKLPSQVVMLDMKIDVASRFFMRTIVNMKSREEYFLQQPKSWKRPRYSVPYVISEINFCYRVELAREEFDILYKDFQEFVKIKANGVLVYDYSFKDTTKNSSIFVCTHHVIQDTTQDDVMHRSNLDTINNSNLDYKTQDVPSAFNLVNIVPVILICFTIIVLGVRYVIKGRIILRQKQSNRQSSSSSIDEHRY